MQFQQTFFANISSTKLRLLQRNLIFEALSSFSHSHHSFPFKKNFRLVLSLISCLFLVYLLCLFTSMRRCNSSELFYYPYRTSEKVSLNIITVFATYKINGLSFFKSIFKTAGKILQIIVNQTKREPYKIYTYSRWKINEIRKLDEIFRLAIKTSKISLKRKFLKAVNEFK